MPDVHIRKARPSDVPAMLGLINNYAQGGLMLPRTEFEMCENVRDFSLACVGQASGQARMPAPPGGASPAGGTPSGATNSAATNSGATSAAEELAGCGALHFYTPQMAELRSLAVVETAKASGIGRKIVGALLEEAREYGLDVVFAFTYVAPFFEKCGFRVVDRGSLPLKVWKDCLRCPHLNCCDEVAMVYLLSPEACVHDSGAPANGLVHLSGRFSRWPDDVEELIQIPRVASPGFQAR